MSISSTTTTTDRPVCLISGGSAGVGRASALRFARGGYDIALCGRRAESLQRVRDEIIALGSRCLITTLDVADRAGVADWISTSIQSLGRVDVLINNAGFAHCRPLASYEPERFDETLAVNVRAVHESTRTVWPTMCRQRGGLIVNISSLASVDPFPGLGVYGACKAWVNLYSKTTADEGREHGIRCVALALGAVETAMLRGLFPDFPEGQALKPEEVAEFLWLLQRPEAGYMNGQTITLKK